MLVFACISPHPPILLPTVGSPSDRAKVAKTIEALESLGPKLAATKPNLIIISSPHPDWGINVPWHFLGSRVWGLGSSKAGWKIENHQEADAIPLNPIPYTLFPSQRGNKLCLYPILTTLDSPQKHYEWGKKIARSLPRAKRMAWIASGDMSHRLKEDGPYGFHPAGPKFDRKFIKLLKDKDVEGILNLDSELVEEAGECGLRSFCMLLGALEAQGTAWKPKVLSYEGPFGVGYLVANFRIAKRNFKGAGSPSDF